MSSWAKPGAKCVCQKDVWPDQEYGEVVPWRGQLLTIRTVELARMLSMNTLQAQAGREMHLCPLQFDIIDRCITQYSEPGEIVFDPFGGLMSVPYRALKLGRQGRAVELNPAYFVDGCQYVKAMADELAMPDLFGVLELEAQETKGEVA